MLTMGTKHLGHVRCNGLSRALNTQNLSCLKQPLELVPRMKQPILASPQKSATLYESLR